MFITIINITDTQGKAQLEKNTSAWAKSLAKLSIPYLQLDEDNAHKQLKEQLTQLITSPDINYIHIYKKLQNNRINYFSGFNKSVYFPSIPDKINSIELLSNINNCDEHNS